MRPPPQRDADQRRQAREGHKATNHAIGFKPARGSLPFMLTQTVLDVGKLLRPIAKESGPSRVDTLTRELNLAIYEVLVRQAEEQSVPKGLKRSLESRLEALSGGNAAVRPNRRPPPPPIVESGKDPQSARTSAVRPNSIEPRDVPVAPAKGVPLDVQAPTVGAPPQPPQRRSPPRDRVRPPAATTPSLFDYQAAIDRLRPE